jgi:hypothetical protein
LVPDTPDPRGVTSKTGYLKEMTAIQAVGLMTQTSTKIPTAGSRNTSFCIIASRLFEIVTGQPDASLLRACKYVLRQMSGIQAMNEMRNAQRDAV